MYAEFDDTLVTGDEMIDSQHRELIGKINDLLRSCEENANLRAAVQMLNYLADYTEFHFGEEERLQEKIGYPGIAEQDRGGASRNAGGPGRPHPGICGAGQ